MMIMIMMIMVIMIIMVIMAIMMTMMIMVIMMIMIRIRAVALAFVITCQCEVLGREGLPKKIVIKI